MMRMLRVPAGLMAALSLGLLSASPSDGQEHRHGQAPSAPATSVRISMEALHAAGGVPRGWRFTPPAGDPRAGRQVFVDFKCYTCHAIKGEQFPLPPGESATAGPDLTGMGGHHPAGYLAESIMNPSAVLVEGPGYIGGDGRSIMPASPDMTLAQLANVVAYLGTQRGGEAAHPHDPARERTAAGYHIRLVYKQGDATGHHGHAGHAGHTGGTGQPGARLLVFLSDPASNEPIPYMPVTARIEVPGKPSRQVKLSPALGAEGFHYGANVTLPAGTTRVTLTLGPAAMRLDRGAPEGLRRAETVPFDWK
jgi:mono/diheme cytochrome c family protein